MANVWKLWIILMYCCVLTRYSTVAAATSRPKRTIGMLENFIETMRQTFSPAQSQSAPMKVIVRYPLGSKYSYYPTAVRMRITPMDPAAHRHVVIVRTVPMVKPPLVAPELRILHRIQPAAPSKTTTIVRYELVPMTMMHSDPAMEPPVVHPLLLNDEERVAPEAAWSIDDSPLTPVHAYDSSGTLSDEQETWGLPPTSANVPEWSYPNAQWSAVPTHPEVVGSRYSIPIEKRILIPGRSKKGFMRF